MATPDHQKSFNKRIKAIGFPVKRMGYEEGGAEREKLFTL